MITTVALMIITAVAAFAAGRNKGRGEAFEQVTADLRKLDLSTLAVRMELDADNMRQLGVKRDRRGCTVVASKARLFN